METSQNQPHPTASTEPKVAVQGDLYAAITAEDEAPVNVVEKKHQSLFMALVVGFMKLTFWMDLTRRSNETAFRIIKNIWRTFMTILYLSGLITLALCLISFVSLPARIEKFFSEKNIQYSSLEMVDYSLTQIDIKDLHDDKNTYQIPIVHIRSTFSDFLKNKILGVEAEGVKINLDPQKTAGNELAWLMNVFSAFNQTNPQKLSINALNISKAVLTIMGKKITVPIAFSVVGDYSQGEKTTAVLFNINEESLSAEGNLSISGTGLDRNIEMTIKSGSLRLPSSPEESLEGKINIKLSGNDIQSIEGTLNLSYAHTKKEIQLNTKKEKEAFAGGLTYIMKNSISEQTEEILADMAFDFTNLKIDEHQNLTTQNPLKITINKYNQNNLYLSDWSTALNGKLTCFVSDAKCDYELNKKSELKVGIAKLNYKDQQIVFNDNRPIELYPNGKTNFSWQLNPFAFQMDLITKNIDSYGYLNDEKKDLDLMIQNLILKSSFGLLGSSLALDINNGYFSSPSWNLENITLSSKDIFDKTIPLNLTANHVTTSSKLLKKPFDLKWMTLTDQSVLEIKINDTDIRLKAQGALDPFKGTFTGQFVLFPIQLENLNFPLNELSDLFISGLEDLSGSFIARGQLKFSGNNIMGPMYIGLKNVHFKSNQTEFVNLNTVVGLQSLSPIQSASNQPFFIEKIKSLSTLYNVDGTLQFINKNIRFNNLEAQIANQDVFLNSAIVPLENPNGVFYFKSEENFSNNTLAPSLNLQGIEISDGSGSLAVTVDVSPEGVYLPAITLKVSDSSFTPKADQMDLFDLFTTGQTRYFVRNGVFTLTQGNHLQTEADGWYLPYSQKKSLSQKEILLQQDLFKETTLIGVPKKLEKLLQQVFH